MRRDAIDRLQNARDDLVGITFGVRAAIFQIALVPVLDKVNRHPDRSTTIRETIAELMNGLRFVVASQTQMVIRTIHTDVGRDVVGERLHDGLKVFLATDFAEGVIRGGAAPAGTIPVAFDGFAIQHNIHFVFLTETHHQIASGPGVIGGFGRALGKDLEFPLAFSDFSVDALMVDASGETELQVLFDDLTGHAAHVFVANAAVVWALRTRVTFLREAQRTPVFIEEVLLLKTNPQVRVVLDGSACVGGMRGAIRVHDFTKNDISVFAASIRIQSHRFYHAVRAFALGLHAGTALKPP